MAELLAIDIGNTHIKLGVYSNQRWLEEWRLSTEIRRTADEYRLTLRGLLHEAGILDFDQAVIASVVPLLTPIFLRVVETMVKRPPLEINPPGYGLQVLYRPPESLGADRFVNALGAHALVGAAVVVDAGTTVTVDAVTADGKFLGGVIAPGPHFLAQALAQGTAKLPHILPVIPEFLIGRSTQDAIAAGVGYGFVGMVNELIARTLKAMGEDVPIVLTGGWAGRLEPHIRFPVRLEPRLTLEGLRVASMRAQQTRMTMDKEVSRR